MNDFQAVQNLLGVRFQDPSVLNEILGDNKPGSIAERLEFLGDKAVALVVAEYLFNHPLKLDEGKMSMFMSAAVTNKMLAKIFKDSGLEELCLISLKDRDPKTLADRLEALIGAIYTEHGFDEALGFVKRFILPEVDIFLRDGRFSTVNHQNEFLRAKLDLIRETLDGKPKIDFYKRTEGGEVLWVAVLTINTREYGRAKEKRQNEAKEEVINRVLDKYVPKSKYKELIPNHS